jgi:peptidoglycan/xylan/chitin deacetylase (PgdA/CDA1 family)
MRYAGISWDEAGYQVELLDDDGRPAGGPARFGPGEGEPLAGYLRAAGPGLVTVVDSTNGVLDGRLMAAGLEVYRADPPQLPERPLLGSAPARALALAARRDLSALARLTISTGSQTGRERELEAGIAASAGVADAMTAAGRCLRHGRRDRQEIALTFDDGPLPPYTGQVLDILERYAVPATFFCVGLNASAHPAEVARMAALGHALGNHTWSHPFLPDLSGPQLRAQLGRTGEAIAAASGGGAPELFRPPYGSRDADVMRWLRDAGPTVVLWDVEPFDWALPGSDAISTMVLDECRPGSVILLHDGGGDRAQTVAALPAIIEGLLDRGLCFARAGDLAAARG